MYYTIPEQNLIYKIKYVAVNFVLHRYHFDTVFIQKKKERGNASEYIQKCNLQKKLLLGQKDQRLRTITP